MSQILSAATATPSSCRQELWRWLRTGSGWHAPGAPLSTDNNKNQICGGAWQEVKSTLGEGGSAISFHRTGPFAKSKLTLIPLLLWL